MTPLDRVVALVAEHGLGRARAEQIAYYIAERSGRLSIATAHSSSRSSLRRDPFLVSQLGLNSPQISAWLALLRGTRTVQRNGRTYGGRRGYVEACVRGRISESERARFARLAKIAATGSADLSESPGCTSPTLRSYVAHTSQLTTHSRLDQHGYVLANSRELERAETDTLHDHNERGDVHRPHGGATAR